MFFQHYVKFVLLWSKQDKNIKTLTNDQIRILEFSFKYIHPVVGLHATIILYLLIHKVYEIRKNSVLLKHYENNKENNTV